MLGASPRTVALVGLQAGRRLSGGRRPHEQTRTRAIRRSCSTPRSRTAAGSAARSSIARAQTTRALRAEVEGLLAALDPRAWFADAPVAAAARDWPAHDGTSPRARRSAPTASCARSRRAAWAWCTSPSARTTPIASVAIKLLRPGLGGPKMLERFRTERQVLADLQHPGIAHLVDGGTTAAGVPWLAMEYVDGVPIDEHCRAHDLSVEARLALFLEVCDAVGFAHARLVVHRDLKPGNIFVDAEGPRAAPRLRDREGARRRGPMTPPTTATEMRAFTPRYASPEQPARRARDDRDRRLQPRARAARAAHRPAVAPHDAGHRRRAARRARRHRADATERRRSGETRAAAPGRPRHDRAARARVGSPRGATRRSRSSRPTCAAATSKASPCSRGPTRWAIACRASSATNRAVAASVVAVVLTLAAALRGDAVRNTGARWGDARSAGTGVRGLDRRRRGVAARGQRVGGGAPARRGARDAARLNGAARASRPQPAFVDRAPRRHHARRRLARRPLDRELVRGQHGRALGRRDRRARAALGRLRRRARDGRDLGRRRTARRGERGRPRAAARATAPCANCCLAAITGRTWRSRRTDTRSPRQVLLGRPRDVGRGERRARGASIAHDVLTAPVFTPDGARLVTGGETRSCACGTRAAAVAARNPRASRAPRGTTCRSAPTARGCSPGRWTARRACGRSRTGASSRCSAVIAPPCRRWCSIRWARVATAASDRHCFLVGRGDGRGARGAPRPRGRRLGARRVGRRPYASSPRTGTASSGMGLGHRGRARSRSRTSRWCPRCGR